MAGANSILPTTSPFAQTIMKNETIIDSLNRLLGQILPKK
jgi:hypothetical protein